MARILLVDDEETLRVVMGRILTADGHTVVYALNGLHALDTLNADPEIDLLITDYLMPGIDGRELAKRIRSNAKYKILPIILLSGVIGVKEIAQMLEEGITAFLAKPTSSKELLSTIQRVLGDSEGSDYDDLP